MYDDPSGRRPGGRSFIFTRGPGGTTIINEGNFSLSAKASSVLCIAVIWAAMIPAIIASPGGWPALIFAFFATGLTAVSVWRRLGYSRLIAMAAIWGGTALAISGHAGNWWMAAFAFAATGATVYSLLRRDDYISGASIAVTWLVVGVAAQAHDGVAWLAIFAFVSTIPVANAFRSHNRALISGAAWAIAGAIMIGAEGYYWLAAVAALASITTFGLGGITLPRRFEWDLFDRDHSGSSRSVR